MTVQAAWLVDERFGKAYPLGDQTTVGRGPTNTIIVRDGEVSRLHAEIRRAADGYIATSFGSSGTLLNGEALVTERSLREGDELQIAFTILRFTHRAPSE